MGSGGVTLRPNRGPMSRDLPRIRSPVQKPNQGTDRPKHHTQFRLSLDSGWGGVVLGVDTVCTMFCKWLIVSRLGELVLRITIYVTPHPMLRPHPVWPHFPPHFSGHFPPSFRTFFALLNLFSINHLDTTGYQWWKITSRQPSHL